MTGFAGNVDLGPAGFVVIFRFQIILLQLGGVAFCTHVIPVLGDRGPMKGVVVSDLLIRIKMKPSLSSLLGGPCVPGKTQSLVAASRKLNEVLLERFDAEA